MYIYKTTNLITGKIYIGKCQRSIEKSIDYFGSGKAITASIKKHGKELFVKEILQVCESIKELFDAEREWVIKLDSTNQAIGYNIMIPKSHSWSIYKEIDPEKYNSIRKKLSESVKKSYEKNPLLKELRKNPKTEKTRKKISDALIGHEVSEAAREKLRQINLGKPLSEEHKNNISKSITGEKNPFYGKTHSKETMKKILETRGSYKGENNPFFGKTHSEKTREKLRQANLGKQYSPEVNKSKGLPGENNPFYGKTHSEKTRKICSLSASLQAARRHGDLSRIEFLESEISSLRSS